MVPPAGHLNSLAKPLIARFLSASSLVGATNGLNVVSVSFSSWVGCPLQAQAFDGAVVKAGGRGSGRVPWNCRPCRRTCGRQGLGGPGQGGERARLSGGTWQPSPLGLAPFGRCFLTQARFPAAKVPCREIPRARLAPWRRRWASRGSRLQTGNSPHPSIHNLPASRQSASDQLA